MELNPWLKGDSLIPIRFPVREMAQKATIGIRTLTKSLDREIDDGLSGKQKGRHGDGTNHHNSKGCRHNHSFSGPSTGAIAACGFRPLCNGDVLLDFSTRGGGANHGADACCFDRKAGCQRAPPWATTDW